MKNQKIIPCVWFSADDGKLANLTAYYQDLFKGDLEIGAIVSLGQTPSGYSEMCEVTLFGQKYLFMNSAQEHHSLNDAVSLMLYCEDQAEIDLYWEYLTKDGSESQCGWCADKYKLRWQIIPRNLSQLLSKPGAWNVLMKQKKIIMKEYE